MSMSLLSRASLLLSLPSSQLGCLFQQGPSNGHWSMSQPSSALCVTGHHKTRKSLRWTSEQDQQPLFQLLRKQGSVMTVKINLEVWGFFIWWWFFCLSLVFSKFLLFSSSNTHSNLHKPPVGSHSCHSGILISHLEPMFSLFFESCHVRTAWSTLEAPQGTNSPSC